MENAPNVPRTIGGFEIISKLGQGGMGAVFKARQPGLDRIVALKVLPPSIAKNATFIDRFQREARASAKLNHPNIIQGIDVGRDRDTGLWFFAMEFVDGPTLKSVMSSEGALPESRVIRIARDMASALECAQQNGIVHRDIKPDNILMTEDGKAKLADLGLAKQLGATDASLTQSGEAVGTPYYMAPEQARGQLAEMDVRTDIYALGATLFHLVTGKPPFDGPTSAVIMAKHLTEKVPSARGVNANVSEPFSRLIQRMMQKDREKRVQSPKELLEELENLGTGKYKPAPSSPVGSTTRPGRAIQRTRRKQSPAAALVFIALLGLAGGAMWWLVKNSADAPQTDKKPDVVAPRVSIPAPVQPASIQVHSGGTDTPAKTPEHVVQKVPDDNATDNKAVTEKKIDAEKVAQPAVVQVNPDDLPPAKAAGPDPEIEMAYTRFLVEMTKHAVKADLSKLKTEMEDAASRPEYKIAKPLLAEELKDLQRAASFEEKGMTNLGARHGEIDLPDEFKRLAGNQKKGKIAQYDPLRGLSINVGQVLMAIPNYKVPVRTIADAAGPGNESDAALYFLVRGAFDEAAKLIVRLPESDRAKIEKKLDYVRSGEAEIAARGALRAINAAAEAKQWKLTLARIAEFQSRHKGTHTAAENAGSLAQLKQSAEEALIPPVVKIFHAKNARKLADGFVELQYDFSSDEQLQDFTCKHGDLSAARGYLVVPQGGGEYGCARFKAPLGEVRSFEITGRALNKSPRMGVYIASGDTDFDKTPRCMCRPYNRGAHLEGWDGTNVMGKETLDWSKDLKWEAAVAENVYTWALGGETLRPVTLPKGFAGGQLAFTGVDGSHEWKDFHIVFKPVESWTKEQLSQLAQGKEKK